MAMGTDAFSTLLATIALGAAANATNGIVLALLGSLLLRNSLVDTASLCLIGALAAAVVGLLHAFVEPRMPDLRNHRSMPESAALKEATLAFVYAPAWGLIGAAAGWFVFYAAQLIGASAGLVGVRDIGLAQVLWTSLCGTLIMCTYVGVSFKFTGDACTFFVKNHVQGMMRWAEEVRKEEYAESNEMVKEEVAVGGDLVTEKTQFIVA